LVALFIFLGWDTTASVAEETRDAAHTSGRAALLSTVILLVVFLFVVTAAQAFDGAGALTAHPADALSALATAVLGNPIGKLVILAVLTSALASAQTSVLPAARTVMAMARSGAAPPVLARVHPRHQTPHAATLAVGGAGAVLFVGLNLASTAVLSDSIAALGLVIAFYYGITAYACPIYFRHELLLGPRNLLTLGLLPLVGAAGLSWVFVRTAVDLSVPAHSAGHTAVLGIGLPLLLAVGLLLIGLVLLALTAWRSPSFPRAWIAADDGQRVDGSVDTPRRPTPQEHRRCLTRSAIRWMILSARGKHR
jgi:amino acid transporter